MTRRFILIAALSSILAVPSALSHLENTAFHQSYRQSLFALMGANFGPMGSMIKGEIPWDQQQFIRWSSDLALVTELDVLRGFPPGSEGGKTRAMPEIWQNMSDFEQKLADLRKQAVTLSEVARNGDRKQIVTQFQKTGGACKACHDEYKSKDYL